MEKYNNAFTEALGITEDKLQDLNIRQFPSGIL